MFVGGQAAACHCVCTNASRGLSAFLVDNSNSAVVGQRRKIDAVCVIVMCVVYGIDLSLSRA